jgi:hypothetical protein
LECWGGVQTWSAGAKYDLGDVGVT